MENIVTIKPRDKLKFTPGDIVILKSGSPPLTVRYWTPAKGNGMSIVKVDWFAEAEALSADFLAEQLVLYEDFEFEDEDEQHSVTAH